MAVTTPLPNPLPEAPPGTNPCDYGIVQQVQVLGVAEGTITYNTRAQNNKLATFTSPVSQVLGSPPQGAPDPVAFKPGAIGNLYLSKQGWSAADANGGIYGLNQPGAILFKWPQCAPFRGIEPLDLLVSSVKIVGDDGTTYELIGGSAAPAQSVEWTAAAPVALALGGQARNVWPMQILVTGKPAQYASLPEQTVDVLDCNLADFVQTLEWDKLGDPVTVRLTERGFEAFLIVQEAIHQYAAGANVTYPGALVGDLDGRGQNLAPDQAAALAIARARAANLPADVLAKGKRLP